MYVIELNDAGVRLSDGQAFNVVSPAYALLEAYRLVLGTAARREARLNPRHTNTHFWSRLSMDGLPIPAPRARTQADLAYAHLLDLWQQATSGRSDAGDEVVFAVPGQFDRNQLALLLGIAKECPFRAVGLVDLAVAAVADAGVPSGTVVHVDAHLHRTVLTRIEAGDELVRGRVDDVSATALIGVQDAMVGLIADAFIRETRFDPLHEAATEQRLYDSMDDWLALLARNGEALLELDTGRNSYRVNLHQDRLVERLRSRYQQLAERIRSTAPDDARLLLSERIAQLPGLIPVLENATGMTCQVLDAASTSRGTLRHIDRIKRDSDKLAFVTRLPNPLDHPVESIAEPVAVPEPEPPAEPPKAAPTVRPTHALVGYRAYSLDGFHPPAANGPWQIGGAGGIGEAELAEPVGTLKVENERCVFDPMSGVADRALARFQGRPVDAPVQLEAGDEISIGEGIRLILIVINDRPPEAPAPVGRPSGK